MANINFGTANDTPSGDLFPPAIAKLSVRTNLLPGLPGSQVVYGAARLGNNFVSPNYFGGLRVFTNMFTQSNWGKQPQWSTENAVADIDKSGNLYRMTAGIDYRKICGRPQNAAVDMVVDWSQSTGDTVVSQVAAYAERGRNPGTITNFAILPGQKKAVFTFTPPPGEEDNLWGFHVAFKSASGNGTCIQPFCAEGDLQGNFLTTNEFYQKYIEKWKIYSIIRDLDMSVANGGGSHAAHGWADRTPSDNIFPSRIFKNASVVIGGLQITAQQTAGQPYYAANRTKVRLMEKLAATFGSPRPPIQSYANKILVGVNAPSGTGSHDITGPDANGDFTVTVTPPSTAATWADLKAFIRAFNYSTSDAWIAALGDMGNGFAPGFTGTEALTVVSPIRMTGGTDPLNADAQSMEMKVRLMNRITAERNGDPCHFHWVAQAGISADFVDGFCRHFKANAAPGCKLIFEISNEPWNTAPFFVDGNMHLSAVGISFQSFGPSNIGTDLRAPVDNSEKGYLAGAYLYGLAHKQRVLFALAQSILGDQLVRGTNGVFHQGGPNNSNFTRHFDILGADKYTDVYFTADYDYSPLGEPANNRTVGNQGQWATGKAYRQVFYAGISEAAVDYFTDAATNKMYVTLKDHTSSTIAADVASGKIIETTPENVRFLALYGQTQTIDNAVRFQDKLATYVNDKGVAPMWGAYEGGATGFDTVFYDDPIKYTSLTWNGTADEKIAHYRLLSDFLLNYYHSPVKREAENFHASERMRRLTNSANGYYTEYAGQGGDPGPNSNHSYMMMRDLEASDDINQRWAGARDAQAGKFTGYFIEEWAVPGRPKPIVSGTFAAGQTLTVTPFTPYRHLSSTSGWFDSVTGNKLQDGGSTYIVPTNPGNRPIFKQSLTDVFGRTVEVSST